MKCYPLVIKKTKCIQFKPLGAQLQYPPSSLVANPFQSVMCIKPLAYCESTLVNMHKGAFIQNFDCGLSFFIFEQYLNIYKSSTLHKSPSPPPMCSSLNYIMEHQEFGVIFQKYISKSIESYIRRISFNMKQDLNNSKSCQQAQFFSEK